MVFARSILEPSATSRYCICRDPLGKRSLCNLLNRTTRSSGVCISTSNDAFRPLESAAALSCPARFQHAIIYSAIFSTVSTLLSTRFVYSENEAFMLSRNLRQSDVHFNSTAPLHLAKYPPVHRLPHSSPPPGERVRKTVGEHSS